MSKYMNKIWLDWLQLTTDDKPNDTEMHKYV